MSLAKAFKSRKVKKNKKKTFFSPRHFSSMRRKVFPYYCIQSFSIQTIQTIQTHRIRLQSGTHEKMALTGWERKKEKFVFKINYREIIYGNWILSIFLKGTAFADFAKKERNKQNGEIYLRLAFFRFEHILYFDFLSWKFDSVVSVEIRLGQGFGQWKNKFLVNSTYFLKKITSMWKKFFFLHT